MLCSPPIIFAGFLAICGEILSRPVRALLILRRMKFCSVLRRSKNERPLLAWIKRPFVVPKLLITPFDSIGRGSRTRKLLPLACLLRGLPRRLMQLPVETCKNTPNSQQNSVS